MQGPRRPAIAAIAALMLLAALPTAASATRGLTTGFESDAYQSTDPGIRGLWLGRTADAGAGIIRLNVPWFAIAPNRPADPTNPGSTAYDFSAIDPAIRDATAHGLAVMLSVNGAPDWAEAPGRPPDATPTAWRPNASDLGDFARAVAARYSGHFDPDGPLGPQPPLPEARALEVWNEPNTSGALLPQFDGRTDVAAGLFRDMLNAAYDGVKAADPGMLVVAGGTDPYGDPPGGPYPPGVQRVQPVTFWQDVLCVQPVKTHKKKKKGKKAAPRYVRTSGCSGPVKFDVLGHHPIDNTGRGPLEHGPLPGDASTPDLGRVVSVLRGAEAAGTTLPGGHSVWVTEFWWDSNPPNPSGAKLATQARWIEQSLYLFWKAGADTAFNFMIGDTDFRPNVRAGFQSGAYFANGQPKPALTAFRFPLVADRLNRTRLRVWGRSPESGSLVIQRRGRGKWLRARRIAVGQNSVFSTKLRLQGSQRLRAKVGGSTSLTWKQR